jgi:hypothetical protein
MSLSGGGRKYLSRWTISAAVVVFAHLGIAGAVLTWHNVMAPEEFPAPVVVNLIPEPPLPPQTERGPIASKGASEKPSEQVPGQRDDGTASKREQRIEPKPVEQPSVTVTIPQSEGGKTELGVDTGGAPAHQIDRGGSSPIDMVNPGMPSNKGAKPNDHRQALEDLLARLAMHPGGRHPPSVVFRSVQRNAIGALQEERGGVTGIIGSSAAGPAIGTSRPATNAIGATVVPSRNARPGPTGPLASNTAALPNLGINGTDLRRPGLGNSSIGGPAKTTTSGGINGTSFRSR